MPSLFQNLPETLSVVLGRLFEPYVVQILPVLLSAFGDASTEVRNTAAEVSKVIMSKIRFVTNTSLPFSHDPLSDRTTNFVLVATPSS